MSSATQLPANCTGDATNVDPPPEPHRLGVDARPQPAPEQSYKSDSPSRSLVKTCRFGSAWIHSGHGQILRNIAEGMRVTDREIVKPSQNAGISANGKVRLIPLDVKRAAVNATNAQPMVTGIARRERHREIILPRLRTARPRI